MADYGIINLPLNSKFPQEFQDVLRQVTLSCSAYTQIECHQIMFPFLFRKMVVKRMKSIRDIAIGDALDTPDDKASNSTS